MASEDIAEEFSFEREKEIAKNLSQRFQWEMMAIGLGQAFIWLTLWPLVIYEILPLWLGFMIATLCACLAYLPSHESQHGNYSRGKANLRWLDTLIGNISLITLSFSYEIMRATHMKHHAYTNQPDKDFDYDVKDSKNIGEVALKVCDGAQKYDSMMANFENDKAFMNAIQKGSITASLLGLTQLILVILFPLETLFLWWIPRKFGTFYTSVFFSWYPHYQLETGRYKDTRFWSHWMPRFINHSMQLHFIHHLHPGIGHYDEPEAIEKLRPFLIARNIPGAEYLPEKIKYNPLIRA